MWWPIEHAWSDIVLSLGSLKLLDTQARNSKMAICIINGMYAVGSEEVICTYIFRKLKSLNQSSGPNILKNTFKLQAN
jgi:hypothetical protein